MVWFKYWSAHVVPMHGFHVSEIDMRLMVMRNFRFFCISDIVKPVLISFCRS